MRKLISLFENYGIAGWLSIKFLCVTLWHMSIASVNIGSLQVSPSELFRGLFIERIENVAAIYDLRFPRIVISLFAGAAVAVSGVLFQAVLKNPLADPGIIGISSGASFVAVLVTAFLPSLYFFTPLFAFAGGVLAFFLVYSLSWKGGVSPLRIILTGVAVSAMFAGLSDALNSMTGGNSSGVASIVEGNITQKTWNDVQTLLPYVIIGLILAILFSKMCNLMSLEDKTARGLGVNVNLMRIVISLIAVLLASISTAVAGAISFLGLIVPHIGRILVGSDHRAPDPVFHAGRSLYLPACRYHRQDGGGALRGVRIHHHERDRRAVLYHSVKEVEEICSMRITKSLPWKCGTCSSPTGRTRC